MATSDFLARVRKRKLARDPKKTRWYVQYEYYDENGKRWQREKYPKVNSEKAARELCDELSLRYGTYQKLEDDDLTVAQYMQQWLVSYKSEIKHSTHRMYEYLTRHYVTPHLGRIKLDKLKPMHIQKLYNYCREELNLKGTTVRRLHSMIHRALVIAVKYEIIAKNPSDAVDPPKMKKFRPHVAEAEHLFKIIEAAKDTEIFAPIFIAINTGLRRGEIMALKWENVDFKSRILQVAGSLQRKDGVLQVFEPKTEDSQRKIRLSQSLLFFLKRLKAQQDESFAQLDIADKVPGYICCWPDGRPMDPDYITRHFHRLVVSLDDVPNLRFHDLRHGFATMLLGEGIPLKVVSDMLGHSSIRITGDIYAHVLVEMQDEAINKLDMLLGKQKAFKVTDNEEDIIAYKNQA